MPRCFVIPAATSGADCWGLSYGYDIWSNLLSATVTKCSAPALSLAVNNSNKVTNTGFTYDAAGNMTNDGTYNYSYDAENRMTLADGVNYFHDGDGRRVKKDENGGSTYDKLSWYGFSGEVLQETNLSGGLLDEYVFFNGQRVARRTSSGTLYYFFSDHLGSVRVVTSATGGIVEESDFYPFGGERVITDTLNNQYKFTGHERDAEVGLDHTWYRQYASNLGRWTSADPANLVDPSGLCQPGCTCTTVCDDTGSCRIDVWCPGDGGLEPPTPPPSDPGGSPYPGAGCFIAGTGISVPCSGAMHPNFGYWGAEFISERTLARIQTWLERQANRVLAVLPPSLPVPCGVGAGGYGGLTGITWWEIGRSGRPRRSRSVSRSSLGHIV